MTRRETDGWGGFSGYMNAKVQKLEEQFDKDHQKDSQDTKIFSDIAIFVNGHTDPEAHKLKALMQKHGGRYVHYYNKNKVTHIIASNLPTSKQRQLRDEKVVSPQWIVDSVEAGVVLPWTKYQLYAIRDRNQQGLDTFLRPGEASVKVAKRFERSVDLDAESDEGMQEAEMEMDPAMVPSSSRVKRAGEEGFLSEFYGRSRLHQISSWGAEFKDYVNSLRAANKDSFPLRELLRGSLSGTESVGRVVMHVDMDCFFVSVGLRSRPELRGKPVAVTHSKGGDKSSSSRAEIASCSYEARAAGVSSGMYLGRAKELCSDLVTIPYDFEGYKAVAQTLYDTVAKYTLDIEAVSCDELIVDCTSLLHDLGCCPLTFAQHLRAQIENLTACTASCGFGLNVLLARVATRKAKPNGAFWIKDDQVLSVMEDLPVRNLPGVGPSISSKLSSLSCEKCGELQKIPLSALQKEFGSKMGRNLYQLCRGIDNTPVKSHHERKSISAEVNYGIRFRNGEEFETFLSELANELSHRMKRCQVKGRTISLKLMIRRPDQPVEAHKFMGHGLCNNVVKSVTLPVSTDDPRLIGQEASSLAKQMTFLPEDVRGMGIQMHKLDVEGKERGNRDLLDFVTRIPPAQSAEHGNGNGEDGAATEFEGHRRDPPSANYDPLEDLPNFSQMGIQMHKLDVEGKERGNRDLLDFVTRIPPAQPAEHGNGNGEDGAATEFEGHRRDPPSANYDPLEDLPNFSQLNASFLDAMPDDIREELGEMLPSSSKPREKEVARSDVARPWTPVKIRDDRPHRSPLKRGRGRGREKTDTGVRQQLTLTSMFAERAKPPPPPPPPPVALVCRGSDADSRGQTSRTVDEEISLFGAKTFDEIRPILKDWVDVEPEPQVKDVGYFMSFLTSCVPRNLELTCQCLSFFRTLCSDVKWKEAYIELENAVQSEMILLYGGPIKVSAIEKFHELPEG